MGFAVAIDGPAGAGKSTVAKSLAKSLGFVYIDTGAMYRAMALSCIREGIDLDNEDAVSDFADKQSIRITYENGEQVVWLNDENVNGFIRTQAVGDGASKVSVYGRVRKKLVELQQKLASDGEVVMDGRDIASCVLPNADVKIYLDANVEVRAQRRFDELIAKGKEADLETVKAEVIERDYRDMHRDISPLVKVPEAILTDSSYMTIDETVATIENIVRKAYKG